MKYDVRDKGGAADGGAAPAGEAAAEARDDGEHEDQREDDHAERGGAIAPVDELEANGDQEGAEGDGLEDIVNGKVTLRQALFSDGDQVEQRAYAKREEGDAEEGIALACEPERGVDQAQ